MVFNKAGYRELVTEDMNATDVTLILFLYKLGTGTRNPCAGGSSSAQSVLLDFSTDGGVNWTKLKLLRYCR